MPGVPGVPDVPDALVHGKLGCWCVLYGVHVVLGVRVFCRLCLVCLVCQVGVRGMYAWCVWGAYNMRLGVPAEPGVPVVLGTNV